MVKNTALDFTVPTGGADLRFYGPSARKCNGGGGGNLPVLSNSLPVYLPQISPSIHLELGQLQLSLQRQYMAEADAYRGNIWQ